MINQKALAKRETPSQYHKRVNLSFTNNHPSNSEIVNYFFENITPDRKIEVWTKQQAIRKWGYMNAMAGMFRACRKWRRLYQ